MLFKKTHTDKNSKARAGVISTAHGEVQTPIFMPVGTAGTVKAVHTHELAQDIGAQIILGNTYHLYLRPGLEVLESIGGLHKFNKWDKPILTDSGGYQVYSLSNNRKITEEGVRFKSHIDGSMHFFTPEYAIDIQRIIGGDIIMAFDECPPYPSEYKYVQKSLDLTHRWLKRCKIHFDNTSPKYGYEQSLIPIVQGGVFADLRKRSSELVCEIESEAYAIGGLSVGEPHEMMYEMTNLVCGHLPAEKARYLMGVGTPDNILECIGLGIDMFDCVLPTRNARHGIIYTSEGIINIKNLKWELDHSPIDEQSACHTSRVHSKSYLRHLLKQGEILGAQLATLQNLSFYLSLVKLAREKILADEFVSWKNHILPIITRRL
ncbi:MAG: tRNA guanosine(34) transglycosylase Tgt [Saprospiraceae bacterium]|nr:tRNA guanosine(34) transglycosylase Tgt [Saprospiraceae bacterium]